jgi:hypothetical protein
MILTILIPFTFDNVKFGVAMYQNGTLTDGARKDVTNSRLFAI